MQHVRRIAKFIHSELVSLERQGQPAKQVTGTMVRFLPDLYALRERVSDAELERLCSIYPGLHRFLGLMDEFISPGHQLRDADVSPHRQLAQLPEPIRSEMVRLLQLAAQIGSGDRTAEQRSSLIALWKEDVKRLLDGEFCGPLEAERRKILSEMFSSIETQL